LTIEFLEQMRLPVSALLPIYNCRERLERHLRSVTQWAPLVQQLIIVDSGSTDGSIELAKEVLTPFGAQFIHTPPGLYQSWNAGISESTSCWCYITTVEDPITIDGLNHLVEVALRHDADVVISPPEMMNHDGSAPSEAVMPSNRLAASFANLNVEDRLLGRCEAIPLFCGCLPDGLLGSSASNLYRTSFLHRHPFPTEFGHCGDTAWGLTASVEANIVFTSRQCARFYVQTRHPDLTPRTQMERHQRFATRTIKALRQASMTDPVAASLLAWFESYDNSQKSLMDWLIRENAYQIQLESMKAKYEGGILQYLQRALRDEWRRFCGKLTD